MAFKGTLREFKVPDILQIIALQKKTGILTFTNPDGFVTLTFEAGQIVGVDAFPRKIGMRMGGVLVKRESITQEMLDRALAIQKKTNQRVGEVLLSMGLVDQKTLEEAIQNQAVEVVLSLFKWKKGDYNFKVLEELDPSIRALEPISTDSLIMEGVQMLDEWPLIKRVIPHDSMVFEPVLSGAPRVEVVDEYADEVDVNGLVYITSSESELLKYVNGKRRVRELNELGLVTEYKLYKSLYNLVRKGIIREKHVEALEDFQEKMLQEEQEERFYRSLGHLKAGSFLLICLLLVLMALFLLAPAKPFTSWAPFSVQPADTILKGNGH